MRNLKRALSLALASVMLLGMMVVGSSAAFADADDIVNTEAVEITAGLGLFAGSDGKFNPKGNVTRAQMATVIVKMLYGSEINADQYKGSGKFNDVAAFEGGWAEGYINLCANLGIVGGYGDGTFKPGNSVTTAEAVTMVINALGVDAGKGTWPMTVMAKAEEIELFEDMVSVKPGTNVALTRDQLAVVVWNGLNYSADGIQGYKVVGSDITFKSWSDAAAYADAAYGKNEGETINWTAEYISEVKNDTLAETVFEIETATGYITANQATGEDYTVVAGLPVALETGLDQLGHFVTVYYKELYKNENKPGVAYCVVEAADYVKVAETISTDKKDFLAAFGTKVEDVASPVLFDNKGFMEGETGYSAPAYGYDEVGFSANAGTYVIGEESGKIIAYIANIASTVDTVSRITTTAGKESIRLSTKLYQNNADEDVIVEYAGIAEDDIVVVKNYRDVLTYVIKPEIVTGKVTKTGIIDGDAVTYINGTAYVNNNTASAIAAGLTLQSPDNNKTYDAYLYNGKLLGLVLASGAANLNDTIYVVDTYKVVNSGNYGSDRYSYYAQGIDATGKEVSVLIGIQYCSDHCDATCGDDDVNTPACTHYVSDTDFERAGLNTGLNKFYTFEKSTDKEQAKKDVMVAKDAKMASVAAGNPLKFNADVDEFFAENITGTQNANELKKDDKYVTTAAGRVYLTADTKFVVVKSNASADELEIATYTGPIAKNISSDIAKTVAATEDENGNYYAEMIVIVGALDLNTEDYIYVSAAASADAKDVLDGNKEIVAYFSATNKYETITADTAAAGFYTNYTIDAEGVYELIGNKVITNDSNPAGSAYIEESEEVYAIIGNSVTSVSNELDLFNGAEAVVVDVRAEDVIEDSDVAAIESLSDIAYALKAGYKVYFDAIVDIDGAEDVVTHIFVYAVKVLKQYDDGSDMADIPANWIEDGTSYFPDCKTHKAPAYNDIQAATHDEVCSRCSAVLTNDAAHSYTAGKCVCGADEPAPAPAPAE